MPDAMGTHSRGWLAAMGCRRRLYTPGGAISSPSRECEMKAQRWHKGREAQGTSATTAVGEGGSGEMQQEARLVGP